MGVILCALPMLPEEIQLPNADFFLQNTVIIWGWMNVGTASNFLKGHLSHFRYGAFTTCLFLTVSFASAELFKLG